MSEEVKKISRLGKAAQEFNVGMSTIVKDLSKEGIIIEESPNTKLSEEAYALLEKKYKADKVAKSAAQEVEIGKLSKEQAAKEQQKAEIVQEAPAVVVKEEKKETPKKVEEAKPIEKEVKEETPVEEKVEVKKTPKEEIPAEEAKTEIVTPSEEGEVKRKGPKVIGKIDLEATKKKPAKKAKATPKEEKVSKKESSSTKKASKAKTAKEVEKIEEPKELPQQEEPTVQVEETPAPVQEESSAPKEQVESVQAVQQESVEQEPVVEEPVEEKQEKVQEVDIKVNAPILQGVKKLGTIDLTAINSKTRPDKVVKKDKEKNKKAKGKDDGDKKFKGSGKPKDSNKLVSNGEEHHAEKGARGDKQKEADNRNERNDTDNKKKRKRDRIKVQQYSIVDDSFEKPRNTWQKGSKRVQRPDVDKEEVEANVRQTMSKMGPLGKSKASKHAHDKRQKIQKEIAIQDEIKAKESKILKVTEYITANELAKMMNIPVSKVIATCMSIGQLVSINQRLEKDLIQIIAEEFDYQVQFMDEDIEDSNVIEVDDPSNLQPRAPIVTVMGHVDHGKTSLLDYIRKTNVIAGEAGGITQHIGAYEVQLSDGRKITFLDTPGHEAFTAMRTRGAKVTDIVIVVIAADDSIMPQTVEAINHAQAAGVPMIFAINKIDKPGADPEKIRAALANMNLLVEEWGGKIQSQDISAKKGINVDELLEKVLIEAEMLELKANPNTFATGTVIESSLDKGRGYVAKILVQNGTLRKGDFVVAGTSCGKTKVMYNERNQVVTSAGPSTPVLLIGLDSAPQAGDTFRVFEDEREGKSVVSKRHQLLREQGLRTTTRMTLNDIGQRIALGDFKELNLIVKADVDGSKEALTDALEKLSTDKVMVKVIHSSVGQVTESDVLLASASKAIIFAFQVRPSSGAKKLAEQEQVDIRTYSVIYDATNDLQEAIVGMKEPEVKETIVCNIEVRETFKISKVGIIAGCYVLDGKIQRTTKVRIIRDGIVIHTGRLGSLKRFKDDVKEVQAGYECGLNIESYNDIKVGDIIEGFEEVLVK